MARFRHLPIWKDAMDLALHLEHAVRRFPRYHKYTLGSELRQTAQRLCRLVARVNDAQGLDRLHVLDELVHAVEEMKTPLPNFLPCAGACGVPGRPTCWRRRPGISVPASGAARSLNSGIRGRRLPLRRFFHHPPEVNNDEPYNICVFRRHLAVAGIARTAGRLH